MSAITRKKYQWMDDGRCLETGGDLFIANTKAARMEAMKICRECPVRMPCLEDAIEQKQTRGQTVVGVWGGVDFGE